MSITSSNAVFQLQIDGLYNVPEQLQGFSVDDIFDADPQEIAETQLGVDGQFTAGLIFTTQAMTVHLLADSPSNELFEQWHDAQRTEGDIYFAQGTIILRGIKRKYDLEKGALKSVQLIPPAKKVLQTRSYRIEWRRVTISPTGR